MFPDIGNLAPESQEAIAYLVRAEILRGRESGLFDPFAPITREEMALVIWRVMNWPRLAARELGDSTAMIQYYAMDPGQTKAGSGWFCAPRLLRTARHVVTETYKDELFCRQEGITILHRTGWIRDMVMSTQPTVIWTTDLKDPIDLALVQIPEEHWQAYLAKRAEAGLGEPQYLKLPPVTRQPIQGEPVTAFGSPLQRPAVISPGYVGDDVWFRTEDNGKVSHWFSTTAGINPGNSGCPVVSFDRELLGIALRKPVWNVAFGGWSGADDLGYVMTHQEIRAWDTRRGLDLLGMEL